MTILNVFALSVYKMIIIPSKASLCICMEDTRVRVHLYINPHPPPRRFRRGKCASSYRGLGVETDYGGSNYDSLFARTVAYPVQVAYWTKEVIAPCGYSVPCQF